jgi:uncharacterized Zn-finger protein
MMVTWQVRSPNAVEAYENTGILGRATKTKLYLIQERSKVAVASAISGISIAVLRKSIHKSDRHHQYPKEHIDLTVSKEVVCPSCSILLQTNPNRHSFHNT